MFKIKSLVSKHLWFILLLVTAGIVRFLYIQGGVVPFLFDHGKDAIAVLHMLVVPKIKFIGPWTSIPGLFFGPAWYYFLAPFALLGGFDPSFFAVGMTLLVLLQMYLVYRYFNIESAVIMGFTNFWLTISRSAWNPFPMTLLSIVILILLKKQIAQKKLNEKIVFGLFFTAAFGFHFSSAFAIFYPFIIVATLLLYKFRPNVRALFASMLGFFLPFIPQLLFEIKNNFVEARAIIAYFSEGESHTFGVEKILSVLQITFGEFRGTLFELPGVLREYSLALLLMLVILAGYFIWKKKSFDNELQQLLIIGGLFTIFPIIGFFFLHFNLWYVLPMIPIVTILLGTVFSKTPKAFSVLCMSIFIVSGLVRLNYYLQVEKPIFEFDTVHYPVKEKVVDYIREDTGDTRFSVYTYMPDVYDFPYQYLFLKQGLEGEELPVEFAYEPGVVSYIREKEDILGVIDAKYGPRLQGTPKNIYYVITDTRESDVLTNWWGRQRYSEILSEKSFGDKIVVYKARTL